MKLPDEKTPEDKLLLAAESRAESSGDSEDEEEALIDESTVVLNPRSKVDLDAIGGRIDEARSEQKALKRKFEIDMPKSAVCIDPNKVLTVGKVRKLKSQLRIAADGDDEDDDAGEIDVDKQRQLIQEAFAGDDVVQDFIKEQKVAERLQYHPDYVFCERSMSSSNLRRDLSDTALRSGIRCRTCNCRRKTPKNAKLTEKPL